jgi:hypothetical protein
MLAKKVGDIMKVKLNGNDFFQVSSQFGTNEPSIRNHIHKGIDLVMNTGTPLNSPVDGIIKKIVDYGNENLGKGIFIETDSHQTVIMGHLSDFKVKVGERVHKGDLVAYSGNTGHSTGSHLHLALKDSNGGFVNPEPLLNDNVKESSGFIDGVNNTIEEAKSLGDFIHQWHDTGSFWVAMYGKPFSQVMGDFLSNLGHDIGTFILGNADIFFLAPAIVFMFGTFIVGKNKFTKWIVPLWFFYFVSTFFHKMLL